MKIDKSQISGRRLMFSIAFFLQAFAMMSTYIVKMANQEAWFSMLIGTLLAIPQVLLYAALMVMFPDKNFLEVLEEVFGKVAGKILSVVCAWFYFTLAAMNLRDIGVITGLMLMPETPQIVLMLVCKLVVAWAVRNGLGVLTRYSKVFTILEFTVVGTSILLLVNQIDFSNLEPMFAHPPIRYVQSIHFVSSVLFGELSAFLMFTPCVKRMTYKEAVKNWFLGVGMATLLLLVAALRDITVLGNSLHLFALPGLVSLRLVNMGEALSHIEILFAIAFILLLFFKNSVFTYASTIGVAQLFKTTQYRHLSLAVSLCILFYAPTFFSKPAENSYFAQTTAPFVWGTFGVVLPLLTFIVAKIRKLPQPALVAAKEQETSRV